MIIGLTGADFRTRAHVAELLVKHSTDKSAPLTLVDDIRTVDEANAIHIQGGELWRVGIDTNVPCLNSLIDRFICDTARLKLVAEVAIAIDQCYGKTRIAA